MIVTHEIIRIQLPDGFVNAVAEFDSPGQDADGDWIWSGPLISVEAVNTSLIYTASVRIRRGNGVAVVDRSLAPGESQIYTGGGPVKNIEDIPWTSLGVSYI